MSYIFIHDKDALHKFAVMFCSDINSGDEKNSRSGQNSFNVCP